MLANISGSDWNITYMQTSSHRRSNISRSSLHARNYIYCSHHVRMREHLAYLTCGLEYSSQSPSQLQLEYRVQKRTRSFNSTLFNEIYNHLTNLILLLPAQSRSVAVAVAVAVQSAERNHSFPNPILFNEIYTTSDIPTT